MILQCGCSDDARFRCDLHRYWACHVGTELGDGPEDRECLLCQLNRWRSVSLSSAATPTRGKR